MAINMSYCKFRNTLEALLECGDDWDDCQNLSEMKAKEKLIALMIQILEEEENCEVDQF